MDDTTSRQQIDELADLYLTDPAPMSPVEGPAPIKLAPKVGLPFGNPADDDDAASAFEDLLEDAQQANDAADDTHPMLRLTEDEADEQDAPKKVSDTLLDDAPAPRAMLEAVVMGNLPGMSGPWLTQYAQLLAQSEGPVVLLHVGDEAIDLELVEPRAEALPAPSQPAATVRIPPMRGNKTGLVGLIDALVRSETTPARTILVRFDTINDAKTLSRLAAMEDWTLLCGSDDASIAAASQQLRSAVRTDPRLADRSVGIMVMGSDDDAANRAAKRIADALHDDLAHRVELIGHLRRMQPVQVRDLGSFPDPVALWPKLVSFFDSLEMPEPLQVPEQDKPTAPTRQAPEPTKTQAPTPPRVEPRPSAQRPAASRPEPTPRFRQAKPQPAAMDSNRADGLRTPDTRTGDASGQATAATARRPAAINKQKTGTAPVSTPAATAPMRPAPTPRVLTPQPELDLVALIAQGTAALDDPAALDARIPDQPETQLVVDAHGTVHLLKKGSGVVSDDVMGLIEAGQWVTDHLELLALTQRDRDFVDTPPVLHLLTDRADLTTQVVGKLAGQIKLHLLQQVTLGRETGWFCTPLG